jgi:heterotetrameric sarcosine oxidase gamma subunit
VSIDSTLMITRLTPRSVALLQLHPAEPQDIVPLVAGAATDTDGINESGPARQVFAVSPSEWLLMNYPLHELRRRLGGRTGRGLTRLTDVSASFISLRVEGTAAREVLAADIGAPWMPQRGKPGQYVRTRLGQVEVVLHCLGEDLFELHIDRSLADYLEGWLAARSGSAAKQALPRRH